MNLCCQKQKTESTHSYFDRLDNGAQNILQGPYNRRLLSHLVSFKLGRKSPYHPE